MDGAPPEAAIRDGVRSPVRHDSADKQVAGTAVYTDDIPEPPGMLHIALGLSEKPCARLASVDLDPVRAAPGVALVIGADDVPGINDTGPVIHDEPAFAASEASGGRVDYVGQALFAVAAETREQARAAAKRARISYAEEPAILTIEQAIEAGSLLHDTYRMARGDAAAAIAASNRRLTGSMRIGGQDHFYLESQIAFATPGEDEDVHVVSSTQHPSEIQKIVALNLGVAYHAVTVEVRRMGGGFGGKESQGNLIAVAAALTARKTGRAAKLRLDRDDDMVLTGKRHPFRIDYEVGFDSTGRIHGVRFEQFCDGGWSNDLTAAIADRAMFHADNAYYYPAAEIVSHRLKTNTVSHTAFRGFGGPQGLVACERMIDAIAHELGKDPLDVRRVNFYEKPDGPGSRATTPYHMRVEDNVIHEIVDELAQTSRYAERRAEIAAWNAANPHVKRGIALTPVKFGISFTVTFLNQAAALVNIYQDGSVMLNHGGTEMGQGLFTKVAQVAATELGVDLDLVKITSTRTDKVPNTSPTAASSGSDMNGMAVKDACETLRARLAAFAEEKWGAPAQFLPGRVRCGETNIPWPDFCREAWLARVQLSATGFYRTPKVDWNRPEARGRPFYYFAYGAAVTEAAVDLLTGENRLLRADILHDVGKSLNPAIDLGQIEGGYVQGAGWLTTEELWWDDGGRLRTHAPSTYKIPCASDRPEMDVRIWAKGENRELTIKRSKAVGEPPLMLGVSAFLALSNAVGAAGAAYPDLDAPATPERLLMAARRVS